MSSWKYLTQDKYVTLLVEYLDLDIEAYSPQLDLFLPPPRGPSHEHCQTVASQLALRPPTTVRIPPSYNEGMRVDRPSRQKEC